MAAPRPLAGRYGFSKRVRGTPRTIIWLARSPESGALVVASVLPQARAQGLSAVVGFEHEHVATVLELVDAPGAGEVPDDEVPGPDTRIAVAQHVEGRSLQQRVDAGPISEETAVEWAIATADALAALHAKGGIHGAVSPRALVVVRSADRPVPVLTHLLVPPSGAYCSPERVTGGGPSEGDDTWALAATLYTALARRPPFQGASRTELARAIVAADPPSIDGIDADLMDLVLRGLTRDPARAITTAAAFRDALSEWVELTGRRSVGDFAPVAALVGPSEPPPNVGDLSLIAALARPDSPEAMAPLTIDPALLRELPALDDGPPPLVPVPDDPGGAATPALAPVTTASGPSEPPGAPSQPSTARSPILGEGPGSPSPPERRDEAQVVSLAPGAPTPIGLSASTPAPLGAARGRSKGALFALVGAAAVVAALGGLFAGKARRDHLEALEPEPPAAAAPRPAAAPAEPPTRPAPVVTSPSGEPPSPTTETAAPTTEAAAPTTETAAPTTETAAGTTETAAGASSAPAGSVVASASSPAALPAGAADVNACVARTLPEGTVGAAPELDYLCSERDLWGIARRLNLHIAKKGRGPGMVAWAYIGRFDLAGIALLRHRCCPGAEPFTAATPKGPCSGLAESTRAAAADPSPANLDAYARDVSCIVSRGIRYPTEWWDRVGADDARGHFEKLLATLRPPAPNAR